MNEITNGTEDLKLSSSSSGDETESDSSSDGNYYLY